LRGLFLLLPKKPLKTLPHARPLAHAGCAVAGREQAQIELVLLACLVERTGAFARQADQFLGQMLRPGGCRTGPAIRGKRRIFRLAVVEEGFPSGKWEEVFASPEDSGKSISRSSVTGPVLVALQLIGLDMRKKKCVQIR